MKEVKIFKLVTMAESLPILKTQLLIDSEKINKSIKIKVKGAQHLLDIVKSKDQVDEESRLMLEKVDSYVQEIKELNSEIHAKIAGEIEIKKKNTNITTDTFGISLAEKKQVIQKEEIV